MTATRILALSLLLTSCAITSSRNKIYRDMAIGAVAGVLIAQTKDENRNAYSVMYGGVGVSLAGAWSVYQNVDEQAKTENEALKAKLEQLQKITQPQLTQSGNNLFNTPLPKEVSGLVEPGEWKRYKMDQWVQDPNQSNTWYRQVEMFEIIPPTTK